FTVSSLWPLGQPAVDRAAARTAERIHQRAASATIGIGRLHGERHDDRRAGDAYDRQSPTPVRHPAGTDWKGEPVASESSFDVVSTVDRQEVDNALNQAAKEISQRFDFRGTNAAIRWAGELGIEMEASAEERVKAVLDVFKDKLVKRKVSLKALDAGEPRA